MGKMQILVECLVSKSQVRYRRKVTIRTPGGAHDSLLYKYISSEAKVGDAAVEFKSFIQYQCRRQDFFRMEECPGHLKAITRPPQGVRGGRRPSDGSEVSFLKTIQSIRK